MNYDIRTMAKNALQAQLLKAGLVDAKKAKKSINSSSTRSKLGTMRMMLSKHWLQPKPKNSHEIKP